MNTRAFLLQVVELTRTRLPEGLRGFQVVGPWASLVKLHYGEPYVHYEVWVQRRTGNIEIGLHFEGAPEHNSRHLDALIRRSNLIIRGLGPEVEPEQWTASWTRIHWPLPLAELDETLLVKVSKRLADLMRVLEPLVREAHDEVS